MDHTRDMRSYMEALEEERRKIQVFQRELPLCMELVTQAIDACTKQLATKRCPDMMKEFIPIRRRVSTSSDHMDDEVVDADDGELHSHSPSSIDDDDDGKKSEWLRSVSLWNPNPDNVPLDRQVGTTAAKSEASSWSERVASPPGSATTSSAAGSGGVNRSDGPITRKQRRCWSPELHRRFVHALQQLGGSHAATPKQIRDIMKVDGLTNDEVKSHLQKYRLHTRRPGSSVTVAPSPKQPQFVVVGGICAPPFPPRAAEASTIHHQVGAFTTLSGVSNYKVATANRKYVTLPPPAAPPQQSHRKEESSEETRSTHPEQGSNSIADSSSTTHTISVC